MVRIMPFSEMCKILSGALFFGEGSPAGFDHGGLYGMHPERLVAFCSKEPIPDCLNTGSWGKPV